VKLFFKKTSKTGEVKLTDEEISVYSKEGYKLPTRLPLTKVILNKKYTINYFDGS
jgi:hypothetical protein